MEATFSDLAHGTFSGCGTDDPCFDGRNSGFVERIPWALVGR
jgi:hypothetical protein